MSKELKRSICLRDIHYNMYNSSPNLEISGRYIKSLHHLQAQLKDEDEKLECQYLINKCLSKHIVFLQEAIINSFNKEREVPTISKDQINRLTSLFSSQYAVSDGKYSLVDIEDLKNMEMLKKSVVLSKNLVLPCKVKSPDGKYHFNTQVIMTKSNVLAYASYDFDENNNSKNVNHNTLISKIGKGIKNNISMTKQTNVNR